MAANPHEDNTYKHLGYLPSGRLDLYSYDGFKSADDVQAGFAVHVGTNRLSALTGGKIVKILIGWSSERVTGNAEFFFRNTLKGENITSGKGTLKYNNSNKGWNLFDLDTAITITPDMQDLYFGYYVNLKAEEYSIPFMVYGITYPNSQYVTRLDVRDKDGSELWEDFSMERPLYIEAFVEDDGTIKRVPIISVDELITMPVQLTQKEVAGDLWITNIGQVPIESLTIGYKFNDQEKDFGEMKLSKALGANSQSTRINIPVYSLGSGEHSFIVKALNGVELEKPLTRTFPSIGVPQLIADRYTRHSIVEYFCSENDYLSAPYYDDILAPGIEPYKAKFSVINQHMNDQFMTGYDDKTNLDDASVMLLDYAGRDPEKATLPVYAINRTWHTGSLTDRVPQSPATYLLYPGFAYEYYEPAIATPTFASVDIKSQITGEEMAIDVTGVLEKSLLPQGEDVYMTLYVLEDSVRSNSQEFPKDDDFRNRFPDGYYVHNNIIRATANSVYGNKLTLAADGTYANRYNVELDEEWNRNNLRVVAFITRDIKNGIFQHNVINAAEVRGDNVGIYDVKDTNMGLKVVNNSIQATDGSEVEVYDLSGRLTRNSDLVPGIYVARTASTSTKVIVK